MRCAEGLVLVVYVGIRVSHDEDLLSSLGELYLDVFSVGV